VRLCAFLLLLPVSASLASAQKPPEEPFGSAAHRALLTRYCAGCHNQKLKTGGVSLEGQDASNPARNAGLWENVLRKVRSGQMPPPGLPQPEAAAARAFARSLENTLDRAAAAHPNPGRTGTHRLNRAEYSNAIRDLLGIDTQPGALLPPDDSGHGFDNISGLLSISPALLERYLTTAGTVSRLAVGDLKMTPVEVQFSDGRGRKSDPVEGALPFNTRGGLSFRHYFPLDAEYVVRVNLETNAESPSPHEFRFRAKAGLRSIGAGFLRESARSEAEAPAGGRRAFGPPPPLGLPAELDLRLDGVSLKRFQAPQRGVPPEVRAIIVAGPYNPTGRGETPSRALIFQCRPDTAAAEEPCARTILSTLAARAFRRPVTSQDIDPLLGFYRSGRAAGDFDSGIERSIRALLMLPDFLFRVEADPPKAAPGAVYRVSDYELASRLSFFLWSSIPDDELLAAAAQGKLKDPAHLEAQVRRLLRDPRSSSLVSNFGSQWLYLRNLATAKPDPDAFPAFDENLRQSFRRESEMFLASIFRENRSLLDLIEADYTFLNQRLAEHYGVPNVYGDHFRRVAVTNPNRAGLLGEGSMLTVTSNPNRTSVVLRGKWILENLLGAPPPPPPGDVAELKPHAKDGTRLSLRQQMEQHRTNAVCASCHSRMDPIGFSLENFDGVGKWRSDDGGAPIDAAGAFPDGTRFEGPAGLRKLLLTAYRDDFVATATEKLMTYALGRGIEPYDKPVLRAIVRQAAADNYRVESWIMAVVRSTPFQMRRTAEP
jgi:hypothetical protein